MTQHNIEKILWDLYLSRDLAKFSNTDGWQPKGLGFYTVLGWPLKVCSDRAHEGASEARRKPSERKLQLSDSVFTGIRRHAQSLERERTLCPTVGCIVAPLVRAGKEE